MIAVPPLPAGALQLTSAWALAALAVTPEGADGGLNADGVTAFEGAETGPAPPEFEACTLNV